MCNCMAKLHALPAWWEGARNAREAHARTCASEEQRDHHLRVANSYEEKRKDAQLGSIVTTVGKKVFHLRSEGTNVRP